LHLIFENDSHSLRQHLSLDTKSSHFFSVQDCEAIQQAELFLEEHRENCQISLPHKLVPQVFEFLQRLIAVPNFRVPPFIRMPEIDRLKDIKINFGSASFIVFDSVGRLAQAPSQFSQEDDVLDVAIIGAGPGGISAAVNLMARGIFYHAIFEKNEPLSTVCELWSREKEADTFYGGPPVPIVGLVGMKDTTRAVFLSRMQSFIHYFHLNVRNREAVVSLKRESNFWMVETSQKVYRARNIMMSAGRYGRPKLLKWEEENPAPDLEKVIVRGVDVDSISNSTVLIIGGGNSAFDYVKSLTAQGTGRKNNRVFLSYHKKPFNVPGSLHAHNNEQLLQWEKCSWFTSCPQQ